MTAPAILPTPTPGVVLRAIWYWLMAHPKTRYTLIFLIVCTICYIASITAAVATGEDQISARALYLPLVGVTDTHEVPIWRYLSLPMDPGNAGYVIRAARYMVASVLWALYALPLFLLIALVDWIVSFEWLAWIAAPFEMIATGVSGVLSAWMLVTLGVLLSAVWIAVGYLRGRTGAATVEFVMIVLVFGFIASPWADPFNWMAGTGSDTASESGFIQQSAEYGTEAGTMVIDEDAHTDDITLAGTIVDITLRDTMLSMSFGSPLEGDCETRWNDNARDPDNNAEDIRKEVIKCDDEDDEVADANQTSDGMWIFHLLLAVPAAVGICFLLAVFLFFLLWQVLQAFISAVVAVVRGFLALFPGNSRTAWINSLFQVVVSGVLVGVFIAALIIYMWGIGQIMNIVPPPMIRVATILIGLIIIIAAITFWKMKKAGKKLGESLAKALGKTGLSKNAPDKQPSNFGTTAKNLTKSAASRALDRRRDARMLTAMKRGATTAATVGTGGIGGAATKVATSAATSAATKKAMSSVGKKGAKPSAGKGAKPGLPAGNKPSPGLPAGQVPAGELPAGTGGGGGTLSGQVLPSSPTPPAPPSDGQQPVINLAGAPTVENAPSSPLPAWDHASTPGTTNPEVGAQDGNAEPTRTASSGGVPVPPTANDPHRVKHIADGKYAGTWVHRNGQMHRPATIDRDGKPVPTMPTEEKVNRAFQDGEAWVITSPNVKPPRSTRNQQPGRPDPTTRPASPAQTPPAGTTTETQSAVKQQPMRTRRQDTKQVQGQQPRPVTPPQPQESHQSSGSKQKPQPPRPMQSRPTQQPQSSPEHSRPTPAPPRQSQPSHREKHTKQAGQTTAQPRQPRTQPQRRDVSSRAENVAPATPPETPQQPEIRPMKPRSGTELRRRGDDQ